jgi:hypothetical protein
MLIQEDRSGNTISRALALQAENRECKSQLLPVQDAQELKLAFKSENHGSSGYDPKN